MLYRMQLHGEQRLRAGHTDGHALEGRKQAPLHVAAPARDELLCVTVQPLLWPGAFSCDLAEAVDEVIAMKPHNHQALRSALASTSRL